MNKIVAYVKKYFKEIEIGPLIVALCSITFIMTEPSHAQNFAGVQTFIQTIVTAITGPIGIAIATLAVMAIGFAFMSGRMDWTLAIAVIIGIAIVFGAATFMKTVKAV